MRSREQAKGKDNSEGLYRRKGEEMMSEEDKMM